jgi:hypothetical protein
VTQNRSILIRPVKKNHFFKQGWEKTREIRKNPWEWEKLVFTGKNGKNGKNCLFLKIHVKSLVNK